MNQRSPSGKCANGKQIAAGWSNEGTRGCAAQFASDFVRSSTAPFRFNWPSSVLAFDLEIVTVLGLWDFYLKLSTL